MKTAVSDNVITLFADSGIDATTVGQADVDVVIERFDNWKNQSSGATFGCFTGACCLMA